MGNRRKTAFTAAAAVLTAAVAALCLLHGRGNASGSAAASAPPVFRLHRAPSKILLQNRTVEVAPSTNALPAAFAEFQKLSRRGTAPYVVATATRPEQGVREAIAHLGARVIGFIPESALLVETDESTLRKIATLDLFTAAREFTPADKIAPQLREKLAGGGNFTLSIAALSEDSLADARDIVAGLGGEIVRLGPSLKNSFKAVLPASAITQLAGYGDIRWIEEYTPPKLLNDYAARPECLNVTNAWDTHGLTGRGQVVATADSGLDTGDLDTLHQDFAGRILKIANLGGFTLMDYGGHGTHTAGSIAGSGTMSGGKYRGMAYEANLYVQACGTNSANSSIYFDNADTYADIFAAEINTYHYGIHSDSWGDGTGGEYDEFCEGLDDVMWENPELLVVMAAGNSGSGANTIGSPAAAKNCLAVGNGMSSRNDGNPAKISGSSSRGPCADGRIKPDVFAPGTAIVSTRSSVSPRSVFIENGVTYNGYTSMSGTSMATPLTAGTAALVRQWLVEQKGYSDTPPSAALVKAILTGGATDAFGEKYNNAGSRAPNNTQGWGRVNLCESIFPENASVGLFDRIPFSAASNFVCRVTTTNTAPLDVQLVWIDYPATAGAGKTLVNDLDLVVSRTGPDGGDALLFHGNGGDAPDNLNTVESVRLADAPPGEYTITVDCRKTIHDSSEGGAAALYVRGAFRDGEAAGGLEEIPHFTVVVSNDFSGLTQTSHAPGTYEFEEGETATFSADTYAYDVNAYGTRTACHWLSGWTGDGDIPSGGTATSVTFRVTQDSSLTWHWNKEPDEYLLTVFVETPVDFLYNGYFPAGYSYYIRSGAILDFVLPRDSPWGDPQKYAAMYFNENVRRYVNGIFTFRLAGAWQSEADAFDGPYFLNPDGTMAMEFQVAMTNATDIIIDYYPENQTYNGLPAWWYVKYLYAPTVLGMASGAADADDDGDGTTNQKEYMADTNPMDPKSVFKIGAFTPGGISWSGGRERRQVVEYATELSPGAVWTPIYTNPPPTPAENFIPLPPSDGPARYYRVRAIVSEK